MTNGMALSYKGIAGAGADDGLSAPLLPCVFASADGENGAAFLSQDCVQGVYCWICASNSAECETLAIFRICAIGAPSLERGIRAGGAAMHRLTAYHEAQLALRRK